VTRQRGDVGEVLRRQNAAAAAVVGVLEANHAGRRMVVEVVVVRRRVDGGVDRLQGQRAVGVGTNRVEHESAQRRCGPVLVVVDMRLVAEDDLAAAVAVGEERREIAHRAAGHEERGVPAGHPGGERFESVDGRIVAEHVVPNLGAHHRIAHGGRREGHGIASQVDGHRSHEQQSGRRFN
jgi:hypothetical protein